MRSFVAPVASAKSGSQIGGMTHAALTVRLRATRLMAYAIAALTLMGSSTSDALVTEQRAIILAVLKDASAHWQGPRPCISDKLESFDGERVAPKRISRLVLTRTPFVTCRSSNLSAIRGDRFLSISAPKMANGLAAVELDYVCPTCGHGTLYALRKVEGRWRVVGRQASWVS